MNNLPAPQQNGLEDIPPGQPSPFDAQSPPVRLRRFLVFLRRYSWLPLLTLLLAVGGAAAFLVLKAPTYVSRSTMWETAKIRPPDSALFTEDPQNYLGTQMELLKSAKLRQAALQRLPTNAVPLDADGYPAPVDITVLQAPKTSVFVVEASAANPSYCRAYLDALMNEYLDYKKNVRRTVSGDTLASISDQVSRTERDLLDGQEALVSYERTNNMAVLQEESTVAGGYLARLKTQLSDLQLQDHLLRAVALGSTNSAANTNASLAWLQALTGITSPSSSPQSADPMVAFKDVEILKVQRERLSKYLRPKHPRIVKLDADIDRAQRLLDIYRRQSTDQLAATYQAVLMKIDNVLASIKEWEAKVIIGNTRLAEADRLKQNVARSQAVYDRLVALLRNVDIGRSIDQETLSILESASPAKRSYRPEIMGCVLALAAGLGAGLAFIFLLAWRDDRFTSITDVLEKLPDEIVGQVPEVRRIKGNGPLVLTDGPDGQMFLEAYRSLRSALLFLPFEGARPKIILVTSAVPNEGKSTVAANLARTLAQGSARVLLVDADLRRGKLHETLGLNRSPGLAELLKDPASFHRVIQSNCQPNLSFIVSGDRPKNPGDLFLGPALDILLARWREQFDHVVIDSTPVFAADDSSCLAPKVDGTLFVVRSRYSGARQVQEALSVLYHRQARVLGLVFNRANAKASSYYYYKYPKYYAPAEQ